MTPESELLAVVSQRLLHVTHLSNECYQYPAEGGILALEGLKSLHGGGIQIDSKDVWG